MTSNPVPPQIMSFSFGDEPMNPADSTAVNCMVMKGDLPIQFKWTVNNMPIVSGEDGFQIMKLSNKLSSLNIESISDSHRGTIKCTATNAAGSSESSAELKVNGLWFPINTVSLNFNFSISITNNHS